MGARLRGLFGSTDHRVSAPSAGLREFRERLEDSGCRVLFVFSDTDAIVEPTALGTVANTDSKLLIYRLFQKGRVLAQDGDGFELGEPYIVFL